MKFNLLLTLSMSGFLILSCSKEEATDGSQPMATCADGIQNGDETGIDCGGNCSPCSVTNSNFSEFSSWEVLDLKGKGGISSIIFQGGNMIVSAGIGLQGGIYRSDDDGEGWEKVLDRAVDWLIESNDGRLYAVSEYSGIFRSGDEGKTWEGIFSSGRDQMLAIDTQNGYMYVGSNQESIYRSTDDGSTWERLQIGEFGEFVVQLAVDAEGSVYALAGSPAKVFRSDDFGINWIEVLSIGGAPGTPPSSYPMYMINNTLYVGRASKKTSDKGLSWQSVPSFKYISEDGYFFNFGSRTGPSFGEKLFSLIVRGEFGAGEPLRFEDIFSSYDVPPFSSIGYNEETGDVYIGTFESENIYDRTFRIVKGVR